MTRRNLELVLLCIGAPIVILLFAMLALNQGQRLGLTTLAVPIGIFVGGLAAGFPIGMVALNCVPVIINTDAHDPSAVGRFDHALEVIRETGFDQNLILNTDEKKLMEFLMG